jgi:hypothetical protein
MKGIRKTAHAGSSPLIPAVLAPPEVLTQAPPGFIPPPLNPSGARVDKTASAVSDLLDLRRHTLSVLIQLLSSGVTDENRIFTCPGVPATDSTALP